MSELEKGKGWIVRIKTGGNIRHAFVLREDQENVYVRFYDCCEKRWDANVSKKNVVEWLFSIESL